MNIEFDHIVDGKITKAAKCYGPILLLLLSMTILSYLTSLPPHLYDIEFESFTTAIPVRMKCHMSSSKSSINKYRLYRLPPGGSTNSFSIIYLHIIISTSSIFFQIKHWELYQETEISLDCPFAIKTVIVVASIAWKFDKTLHDMTPTWCGWI